MDHHASLRKSEEETINVLPDFLSCFNRETIGDFPRKWKNLISGDLERANWGGWNGQGHFLLFALTFEFLTFSGKETVHREFSLSGLSG